MKKPSSALLLLVFLASCHCIAQSWQWGKAGGSDDPMNPNMPPEQISSMATDAQGNIYTLSPVGVTNLQIDGNPKQAYSDIGPDGAYYDYMISAFGCDGTYRWSKVIGGYADDELQCIRTDNLGNVYAVGRFYPSYTGNTAIHFDTDLTLPVSNYETNTFKQSLMMVKYDNAGNLGWVRMPQPDNLGHTESYSQNLSMDMVVDGAGNSYWLTLLTPGIYANGNYTVTAPGYTFHFLKYDSTGNFTGGFQMDMSFSAGLASRRFKIARNPTTGTIYVAGYLVPNQGDSAVFGGQPVTHDLYIAAFNSQGQFLWKKESTQTGNWFMGFNAITLDTTGNIYLAGGTGNGMDFQGHTFMSAVPGAFPIVVKLNPDGNLIWATNAQECNAPARGIAVNGDEVGITGRYFSQLQWGSLNAQQPNNNGSNVFLARFNNSSGSPIAAAVLEGNAGDSEVGTAITADQLGNYYVGGALQHYLYVNSPTPLVNNGADTDFFLAKFGTANCSLGTIGNERDAIKVSPNPVKNTLSVSNLNGPYAYWIFDGSGKLLANGSLGADADTMNFGNYPTGIYFLKLKAQDGNESTLRIVKE